MIRRLHTSGLLVAAGVFCAPLAGAQQPAGPAPQVGAGQSAPGAAPAQGVPNASPSTAAPGATDAASSPAQPEVATPAREVPVAAPAAEAAAQPQTAAVEEAKEEAEEAASEGEDELEEPGYIPGYQQSFGLGLSPFVPRNAGLPGGVTAPPSAPTPSDGWAFNFSGFMSAALRMSAGERRFDATSDQSQVTLHASPTVAESYGSFHGTNSIPGNWVEMHFEYGNPYVSAHVLVDTWNPSRSVSWYQIGSQNFVDQAFLVLRTPDLGGLKLTSVVGSFTSRYGALGQYDVGRYGAAVIGEVVGTGEKIVADYKLNNQWGIKLEHGISGRFERPPLGSLAGWVSVRGSPAYPSSWVHHAHAGFYKLGEVQMQGALHYISNWSQDDRTKFAIDDPDSSGFNEREPRDARLTVVGADFRLWGRPYGHFAAAAAYSQGHDLFQLTGFTLFGARTGESMGRRFFGQYGSSTGSMFAAGFEYSLSIASLLRYPEPYGDDGPDIIAAVMANYASIQSSDPAFDGKKMLKFGGEATYRFLPWVSASFRYDYVAPNSKDSEETFHVLAPKLIFKSNWTSHEQVTLHYVRWLLGKNTYSPFPDDLIRERLDNHLIGISFSMWW